MVNFLFVILELEFYSVQRLSRLLDLVSSFVILFFAFYDLLAGYL